MPCLQTHPRWRVLCVEYNHLAQMAIKNQLTALNCNVAAENQQPYLDAGMQQVLSIPLQTDQAHEVIHQYAENLGFF